MTQGQTKGEYIPVFWSLWRRMSIPSVRVVRIVRNAWCSKSDYGFCTWICLPGHEYV